MKWSKAVRVLTGVTRKGGSKIPHYAKQTKVSLSLKLLILFIALAGISLGTAYALQKPMGKLSSDLGTGSSTTTPVQKGVPQSNKLFSEYPSWIQDFSNTNSGTLNTHDWEVYKGPAQSNNEAEYYTDKPANLRIANGALTLEAKQQSEPQGYKYSSARIDTDGKKTFLYGRIDITAKVPEGVGTWPAIWLLPANSKYEDLSPSSDPERYLNGGEIDLMEQVGTSPGVEYGIAHSKSDLNNADGVGAYKTVNVNDAAYNLYTLLWTPTSITFEVNNVPFFTYNDPAGSNYTTWPFNQPFYLILNLALGGSWGGEDTAQYANGIDNATLPASMDVQSIYYYPYVGASK